MHWQVQCQMKCAHCAMIMVVIRIICGRIVRRSCAHAAPSAVLITVAAMITECYNCIIIKLYYLLRISWNQPLHFCFHGMNYMKYVLWKCCRFLLLLLVRYVIYGAIQNNAHLKLKLPEMPAKAPPPPIPLSIITITPNHVICLLLCSSLCSIANPLPFHL